MAMRKVLFIIMGFLMGVGATFGEKMEVHGVLLEPRGTGVLKYKGLIKVYDATLYLAEDVPSADVLGDVAKRIAVTYHVDADRSRFHKAGKQVLDKAYTAEQVASIKDRLDQINSWYDNAKSGEQCAITYLPGKGTLLTVNKEERGWIPGEDFARMYFSIWLGEPCASKSLRKKLLNEK